MDKITVLLSSYNGSKYIDQQIESIVRQINVDVNLVIRDDSSNDNTVEILQKYKEHYKNIEFFVGKNLGARGSFRELVLKAGDSEYYAFSDQDDIWYEDKLSKGVDAIKGITLPALYMANQNCVDEHGCFQYLRLPSEMIQPDFTYTLFKNNYSGCTMVFNKQLIEYMKMIYRMGENRLDVIHDGLALEIAQLTGIVIYDPKAYMDFRRHGNNYSEAQLFEQMSVCERVKQYLHKFRSMKGSFKNRGLTTYECKLFLKCFGEVIEKEKKEVLQYIIDYRKNPVNWFKFLFCNKIKDSMPSPKVACFIKIFFLVY